MARTRTPTAELKLRGTYRKDRHEKRNEVETEIAAMSDFKSCDVLEPPVTIIDPFVIEYYKYHTHLLIQLQILQPSDVPELNLMYEVLQQERKVQAQLLKTDISDLETYEALTKLSIKLINTFSHIAAKYYISPSARTHLELDNLQLEKAKNENQSIVQKIINNKK